MKKFKVYSNVKNAEDMTKLKDRYDAAKINWINWVSLYDEAYQYSIPNRNPFWWGGLEPPRDPNLVEGIRKNLPTYDTTAVSGTRQLVSKIHAALFPPDQKWFSLTAGSQITNPNERLQLNSILFNFTETIFKYISSSNFDLVINEFLQDMVVSTAFMMPLEGDDDDMPVKFKSVQPNLCFPEANRYNEVDTVWRDWPNVHADEIEYMWPQATLSHKIKMAMYRDPRIEVDLVEGVAYDCNTKKYNIVLWQAGDHKDPLLNIYVDSSPWIVGRWSKIGDEIGGRGPVIEALPTIRTLNKLVEYTLRANALAVSPPLLAFSDGVFNPNNFTIAPNKIIPISNTGSSNLPLQKLDMVGNLQMGNMQIQDLRTQINTILYTNPIRPIDAPQQTATEVMVRQQAFMEEIGPAFGRLSQLIPEIVNRVIFILRKRGLLPKMLSVDGKKIAIKFNSPLEQSAGLQDVQTLTNFNQTMGAIIPPQYLPAVYNIEQLPTWIGERMGISGTLIKGPDAILAQISQIQQGLTNKNVQPNLPNPIANMANPSNTSDLPLKQAG